MSPNQQFPPDESPEHPITLRMLEHSRLTHDVDTDSLTVAVKDELLVRVSARTARLHEELQRIAEPHGSLRSLTTHPVAFAEDVEIWRLRDPAQDAVDHARRLRTLARPSAVATHHGPHLDPPAVSPNHVCVLAKYNSCPATPPAAVPPPPDARTFVRALPRRGPRARVVVIDSGYIHTNPPHDTLDARVTAVKGAWLDTSVSPAQWRTCPDDAIDKDADGRLNGVVGHGTFIAGLIANRCRESVITVVGQRHDIYELPGAAVRGGRGRLFSTEFDIAHSLLHHGTAADVVNVGFAFPTLDGQPSIALTHALTALRRANPGVAVVAPAGNESSSAPYWPAAHPDVVGVASTNRLGTARSWFSNWGAWADCCARGQDVRSTFIHWRGPVEGGPKDEREDFVGWARWNGTSFAAPVVTGAIAESLVTRGGSAIDAYHELLAAPGVRSLSDCKLCPFPGISLPYLG